MIRPLICAALVGTLFSCARAHEPDASATYPPSPAIDFAHLPWVSGESLTYEISWGSFKAAEGTFIARKKSDHWEFRLELGSRGMVDEYYPFHGYFWSILMPPPWRSAQYGEYRFEPSRTTKEQTKIDYDAHLGTREIWQEGKTHTFSIAEDSIDDVGTMLYHLRAGSWKPGDRRLIHVYESDSEKEALAECQALETRSLGVWPSQPLLRIHVLPGKGTHHRGGLMLWITDDARHLPVHADLNFRYGTFSIDLSKVSKVSTTSL